MALDGIGLQPTATSPDQPAGSFHLPCIETWNSLLNFWQMDNGQHHSQSLESTPRKRESIPLTSLLGKLLPSHPEALALLEVL